MAEKKISGESSKLVGLGEMCHSGLVVNAQGWHVAARRTRRNRLLLSKLQCSITLILWWSVVSAQPCPVDAG